MNMNHDENCHIEPDEKRLMVNAEFSKENEGTDHEEMKITMEYHQHGIDVEDSIKALLLLCVRVAMDNLPGDFIDQMPEGNMRDTIAQAMAQAWVMRLVQGMPSMAMLGAQIPDTIEALLEQFGENGTS